MEQLGGQLRVDSKVDEGSSFSFLIPFATGSDHSSSSGSSQRSRSRSSRTDEIESLVNALAHNPNSIITSLANSSKSLISPSKVNSKDLNVSSPPALPRRPSRSHLQPSESSIPLRVLIVEDNDINRTILAKRLTLDGHIVVNTTNGQEGLDMVQSDREFDCVLMDIQCVTLPVCVPMMLTSL